MKWGAQRVRTKAFRHQGCGPDERGCDQDQGRGQRIVLGLGDIHPFAMARMPRTGKGNAKALASDNQNVNQEP